MATPQQGSTSKVTYGLKRVTEGTVTNINGDYGMTSRGNVPYRWPSIPEVLKALHRRAESPIGFVNGEFEILKFTEVPGKTVRRVLYDGATAYIGESTQYAIKNACPTAPIHKFGNFAEAIPAGSALSPTSFNFVNTTIDTATLYRTQTDAIRALQNRGPGSGEVVIVRIGLTTTAATFTEEVLG